MLKKLKIALLIVILAEEIRNASRHFLIFINTKKCPSCKERTINNANYCPNCRYKFN